MPARHRSALMLGILAFALLLLRWPLDNYTCDMRSWGKYRPAASEGSNFARIVFRGGGGTPAIYALLCGSRYIMANLMLTNADIFFHNRKLYEMVAPMDAAMALNPSLTEVGSTYSRHQPWNIYSYTDNLAGIPELIRAVQAHPDIPVLRANLANVYAEREGNILKAVKVLQPVVESGKFPPLTPAISDKYGNNHPEITDRYWDPFFIGHRLAFSYKLLGIFTGDWHYIQKSIATYRVCERLQDPKQQLVTQSLIDEMLSHMHDEHWLLEQRQLENNVRRNFGLPQLEYGKPAEEIFPESSTGIEDVDAPHVSIK